VAEPPSGEELIAAFADWAASQRIRAAAANRARERSLRDQAAAQATWSGLLLELAERRAGVTAAVGGRRWQGRLVGVGRDFCVLETRAGRFALIPFRAISVLWPEPLGPAIGATTGPASEAATGPAIGATTGPAIGAPASTRRPALDLSLPAALSMLVDDRYPVTVVTTSGLETAGLLVGLGDDVLTIQADPPARSLAYVPLHALSLCELR
jgi:hypothetical protein